MLTSVWRRLQQRLKQQTSAWREVALPGLLVIVLILAVRWIGLLQVQEWMALDALSRNCPSSAIAPSVVIVGIDEADLNAIGGFPISDQTLVDLLTTLKKYQPAVIGLNLFRSMPVQPGHDALVQVFKQSSNLIGIEMALNAMPSLNIAPPASLPAEQIGFVDFTLDEDGKLRRMILASSTSESNQTKYSFALQLVRMYLAMQNIPFQTRTRANDPIQFGPFQLYQFHANSGGYVRADAINNQILVNFCASQRPFPTLSLSDVLQGKFAPELMRDRIILIGMTAPSVKDVFFTSALRETLSSRLMNKPLPGSQLIYGVEVQAHATNQIINAVFQRHPQLRVWGNAWQFVWIVGWGLLGILSGVLLQSPWKSLLCLSVAAIVLLAICFVGLTLGWWISLIPAGLALSGAGFVTTFLDRDLRFELESRRMAVERTYEAVHNGPLQHLAVILRNLNGNNPPEQLEAQLQSLNEELRNIFEHMRQAMLTRSDRLYLKENLILDLQAPISELLHQVYNHTLEMQAPGFAGIQTYISPDFELLKRNHFNIKQKRGLCLFLQEALWNVGNHAIDTTYLDVMCVREADQYVLRITDNGSGMTSSREGEGTKQAKILAWELGGHFQRRSHHPQGIICELIFPIHRSFLSRLRQIR